MKRFVTGSLLFVAFCTLSACGNPGTVKLFNGKDLTGWDTHTVETGKENPGVFTVQKGMLKIAGGTGDKAYFGGIISKEKYSNYKLVVEYKFTGPTYGTRKDKARDSGVLVHCVGPTDPKYPWLTSYEAQIIEGGLGDILIVNMPGTAYHLDDEGKPIKLSAVAEAVQLKPTEFLYKPGSPKINVGEGFRRINWWGRDPDWKDVADYPDKHKVEKPLGQWNRMEVICEGDTLLYRVNGKVVNAAEKLTHSSGRILVQTEGAEIWFRNIEMTPL